MPRPHRFTAAGNVYHVVNRGVFRTELFSSDSDYELFLDILRFVLRDFAIVLCAHCIMPNHWHLALWEKIDQEIPKFMHKLTSRHVRAYHRKWETSGHIYQGRYYSHPVQNDAHYINVIRYIEQNPERAEYLNATIDSWQWSSAWDRANPDRARLPLREGPVALGNDWLEQLKMPIAAEDLSRIRVCEKRGQPYGDEKWVEDTARELKLESSIRTHGGKREKKPPKVPGTLNEEGSNCQKQKKARTSG